MARPNVDLTRNELKELGFDIKGPSFTWASERRQNRLFISAGLKPLRTLYRLEAAIRQQIVASWPMQLSNVEDVIGVSIPDIATRLQETFKPGMYWFNYGEWQIDHIKPRRLFKSHEIKKAFDISNLQALWKIDNLKKGSKWEEPAGQK